MKVLELFGGIGACTQALKRLGIDVEIADYVEIDKYAVASYNAMNGTHFEPQDICEWDKDIDVDLIMHGSPCQDISLAGKQAGADEGSGTRSSLMYETIRIVNKLKPKYVIWENVKNLISKKHRHNFDKYLQALSEGGYRNYWQVLNAKDYGIPQNRERVFTISIRNDIDKDFKFPQKQELKLRLKDLLEDEVDEKYYLSEKMINYIVADNEKWFGNNDKSIINKTVASAINTGEGQRRCDASNYISKELGQNFNIKAMGDNFIQYNNQRANQTIENHKEEIKENSFLDCYNNKVLNDGTTPTITSRISASNNSFIAIKNATKKGYDEATEGDSIDLTYPNSTTRRGRVGHQVSQTIPASDTKGVVVPQYNNLRIRKLTPKECWRLMGFSDEAFEKARKVNSNTQLYKQAGNSIVVNVLVEIFKKLLGDNTNE